jgi:titin
MKNQFAVNRISVALTLALSAAFPATPYAAEVRISGAGLSCANPSVSSLAGIVTLNCDGAPSAPGAPVISNYTAGNASATLAFAAGTGGAATSYQALCSNTANGGKDTQSLLLGAGATSVSFAGMINDTSYLCTLTATNSVGSASATSVALKPSATAAAAAPLPPTLNTATAGTNSALLAFTPNAGGTAATNFDAQCMPGAITGTAVASPISVALVNGTGYSCSVTARNALGSSPSSNSVTVTPPGTNSTASAPAAPASVTAAASNGSATISFAPPPSNGGSAVTSYTISCTDGQASPVTSTATVPSSATSATLTGLTNGASYTCGVTATNANGTSTSGTVANVQPVAGSVPSAPQNVTATITAANTIQVSYAAPAAPGTTAVDAYRAQCGAFQASTPNGTVAPIAVTVTPGGGPYSCTAEAHNSIGWSTPPAAASGTFSPQTPTAPDVPAAVTATSQGGGLALAFSAPAAGTSMTGAAATITRYDATCSPAGSGSVTGTPAAAAITVSGLATGSYTCTVKATNSAGLQSADSLPSTSATVSASCSTAASTWTNFPRPGRSTYGTIPGGSAAATTTYSFSINKLAFPTGNTILFNQFGTATAVRDHFISECAGDTTPPAGNPPQNCQALGSFIGRINIGYSDTPSTQTTNSCNLQPGRTYYMNMRTVLDGVLQTYLSSGWLLDTQAR